jgi:hypothetical protein
MKPPTKMLVVKDSLKITIPKATATTGFTYAYVDTKVIGALSSSQV